MKKVRKKLMILLVMSVMLLLQVPVSASSGYDIPVQSTTDGNRYIIASAIKYNPDNDWCQFTIADKPAAIMAVDDKDYISGTNWIKWKVYSNQLTNTTIRLSGSYLIITGTWSDKSKVPTLNISYDGNNLFNRSYIEFPNSANVGVDGEELTESEIESSRIENELGFKLSPLQTLFGYSVAYQYPLDTGEISVYSADKRPYYDSVSNTVSWEQGMWRLSKYDSSGNYITSGTTSSSQGNTLNSAEGRVIASSFDILDEDGNVWFLGGQLESNRYFDFQLVNNTSIGNEFNAWVTVDSRECPEPSMVGFSSSLDSYVTYEQTHTANVGDHYLYKYYLTFSSDMYGEQTVGMQILYAGSTLYEETFDIYNARESDKDDYVRPYWFDKVSVTSAKEVDVEGTKTFSVWLDTLGTFPEGYPTDVLNGNLSVDVLIKKVGGYEVKHSAKQVTDGTPYGDVLIEVDVTDFYSPVYDSSGQLMHKVNTIDDIAIRLKLKDGPTTYDEWLLPIDYGSMKLINAPETTYQHRDYQVNSGDNALDDSSVFGYWESSGEDSSGPEWFDMSDILDDVNSGEEHWWDKLNLGITKTTGTEAFGSGYDHDIGSSGFDTSWMTSGSGGSDWLSSIMKDPIGALDAFKIPIAIGLAVYFIFIRKE